MAKIKGFAEWLPEYQVIQDRIISTVRETFSLHGFSPLLTRSIEPLEELLDQGETDKEIFAVSRLGSVDEPTLGLHYDLTVPFARYVSENAGQLTFPYRRYQIQPAWRGERPQLGRFREFIQADADIVDTGSLDIRHDADLLALFSDTLGALPIPEVKLVINNRKLLQGFYAGLGLEDVVGVLRAVDKLPKVGADKTKETLLAEDLTEAQIEAILGLTQVRASTSADLAVVKDFGVSGELFDEGVSELSFVLDKANENSKKPSVDAALYIARGFNYYTGTVAESELVGFSDVGSICSGGRYDNLVSVGKQSVQGVGFSIGISRLIAYGIHFGFLESENAGTAEVVVAVNSEDTRSASNKVAGQLRDRGISCLVSDTDQPYGKQIKQVERLGVKYVAFISESGVVEMRDLDDRTQVEIDLAEWTP